LFFESVLESVWKVVFRKVRGYGFLKVRGKFEEANGRGKFEESSRV
jgi:hypothetical protein